jgi:hypothetical protein
MHPEQNKGIGKMARFVPPNLGLRGLISRKSGLFVFHGNREVFMKDAMMKSEYDLNSAVTFLLLGLGIGTVLAILFNPKPEQGIGPEGLNSWRTPGAESQRVPSHQKEKDRAA